MLRFVPALVALVFAATLANAAGGNLPPLAPVITEPRENRIINAADVHMECLPMQDPNPGDTHKCSDWRIVDLETSETVWLASCAPAELAVHIHLGDGVFLGALAGERELAPNSAYAVQVRHFDSSGDPATEAGPWSTREFRTAPASVILPYVLTDVLANPAPELRTESGSPLAVPTSASIHLLIGDSTALEIRGNGTTNEYVDFPPEAEHFPATLLIHAGEAPLNLPAFDLSFVDATGASRTIYAPQIVLEADEYTAFWVESTGATWERSPGDLEPNFETLARGLPIPWLAIEPGFVVEEVAGDFQLPTVLAFVPNQLRARHGDHDRAPLFYVGELYGAIKTVTGDGTVHTFAENLLRFDPTGSFPGSGEIGIGGIAVHPRTGEVFASIVNPSPQSQDGLLYPQIYRFLSTDGGLTATTHTMILDLYPFQTTGSHQISNLSFMADESLLVHNGDSFRYVTPLNLHSPDGKILRIDTFGRPLAGNPFYNAADGIGFIDYVWAYGFRNPFGGTIRKSDGLALTAENGPAVDRLAVIRKGASYGYDGTDESMFINATYNWIEPHAPVGVAVTEASVYDRSGFPPEYEGRVFVAETGPTYVSGMVSQGKQVRSYRVNSDGVLEGAPSTFLRYIGNGRATACGLAAGPDGLYFTELYKDLNADTPIDRGARVLRVRYTGRADILVKSKSYATAPPLDVLFQATHDFGETPELVWDFGDGTTSTLAAPLHRYSEPGRYDVTLSARTPSGARSRVVKRSAVVIGPSTGLLGEYFDHMDFRHKQMERFDPQIAFDFGYEAPVPQMEDESFSIRWRGHLLPRTSGVHRIIGYSDDGLNVSFDGTELFDFIGELGVFYQETTVTLTAGVPVRLDVDYSERYGRGYAYLGWQEPGGEPEYIPASQLFAPANLRIEEQSMRNVTAVGDVIRVHTRIANDGPGIAVFPVLQREWPGFLRPIGVSQLSLPNIDPGEEISVTMFAEAVAVGDGISTATITMSGYEMDRSDDVSTIFIVSTGDTGTGWFAR